MPINLKSLQARLLNVSREEGVEFQLLLHRLGAEQFLFRLSRSSYKSNFVFKGGTLLSYVIDTDRKTRDLDFSIKQLKHHGEELPGVVQTILDIQVDDGIAWKKVKHSPLNHPEMEYPGVRIICDFLLGKMKGQVRIDLAAEDVVKAKKSPLKRLRYKGIPLIGDDFELLVYPSEAIFAEKLQIAVKRGAQNTRMKDYYDLFKLCSADLDAKRLNESITETFKHRKTEAPTEISFDAETLNKLQEVWEHYIKKQRLKDAPVKIGEILKGINTVLRGLAK